MEDITRADAGDIEASTADIGPIDRVWDRAALVALPPDIRQRYVRHLRQLVASPCQLPLNVFGYDESHMAGPPFSITQEEVRNHFEGCEIILFDESNKIDHSLPSESGVTPTGPSRPTLSSSLEYRANLSAPTVAPVTPFPTKPSTK